jgi:hypothetical protein
MTINWKIIAIAIVILVIVVIIVYYQLGIKPSLITEQPAEIIPPPATGNIDDAINALIQDAANEQVIAAEEDADTSLIDLDSQEISNFGQSYNENEI